MVTPRQAGLAWTAASQAPQYAQYAQYAQHDTPRVYQEMPSLQTLFSGLKGEADYASMHPLLPLLRDKLSELRSVYADKGSREALRDFGLI